MAIEKVAVLGAGVMGSGIAAHLANAGVEVLLLDIVPEGADNRSVVAETALAKLQKAKPAPLMHKRFAKRIKPGNLEDHLALLGEVDWIIEAVIERLDIKQALYSKIDLVRKKGSMVSSNTSTIPLEQLIEGQTELFAQDFLITHFFNPPRYMRLLELVGGSQTRAEALDEITDFADRALGKGVVRCHDTPGFIANRIGIYWIQTAISAAIEMGISVEEADAIVGRPMGIPKTGIFGLSDLVGIDLMPHLMQSMTSTLAEDDPFQSVAGIPKLIENMIADGYTGRKGKGGFYRINRADGGKVKEAIDLQTGDYHPVRKPELECLQRAKVEKLPGLVSGEDKGAQYAWRVLSKTLSYAAALVPEIADDIAAVDSAMRLGYNWKFGPFELMDQLGVKALRTRLEAEGETVPELLQQVDEQGFYILEEGQRHFYGVDGHYHPLSRPDGVLLLEDIKRASEPLKRNGSASLWDIGDGVVCLEFHSKMNALDTDSLTMVRTAVELVQAQGFQALVIYNEGSNFSAGANLGLLAFVANVAAWDQLEGILQLGQESYQAIKQAPFPVVGAPSGMALGGGCEILLHCDAIQAHAESYIGLVEVGVGIVPGWGGCKELLLRGQAQPKRVGNGPMPAVAKAFELIGTAAVATSAMEARDNLILRDADGITMNRDRVLAEAKAKALRLVEDYHPPEPMECSLPGPTGKAALMMAVTDFHKQGKATDHDVVVSQALADVLSGGETDSTELLSEEDLLTLERQAFMRLVRHPDTLARIEHMLTTGKPLRN